MTEEEPLGIMLYGYDAAQGGYLREHFSQVFETPVVLLSASGKEDELVQNILEAPSETFEEKETKILMFLGFDDEKISKALSEFPKDGSAARPIFCGLTEQNINWPLTQLLAHLLEEERYWKSREAAGGPPHGE